MTRDWTNPGDVSGQGPFGADFRYTAVLVPQARIRPICKAMVIQEYNYAYAVASVVDGVLDTLILPHVNSDCMQVFIGEMSAGHPEDRIVMVLDSAGWHTARALVVPSKMSLLPLPPFAPELNPVEHICDELREKAFGNLVFDSL